jgi:hypothetical protein
MSFFFFNPLILPLYPAMRSLDAPAHLRIPGARQLMNPHSREIEEHGPSRTPKERKSCVGFIHGGNVQRTDRTSPS